MPRKRSRSHSPSDRHRSRSGERSRRKKKEDSKKELDPKAAAIKYGLEDQSTLKKPEEKKEEKKDDSFLEFKKALEMAGKQEAKPVMPEITTKGTGIVPVSLASLKKVAQQKKSSG